MEQDGVHAGLGLYEYMLLAEELSAEPIYVINNGISHQESVSPADLQPFLDETMDALEYLTGPSNSTWGAVRASMGRKKPWTINYLAIGNEVLLSGDSGCLALLLWLSPVETTTSTPGNNHNLSKNKGRFRFSTETTVTGFSLPGRHTNLTVVVPAPSVLPQWEIG